MRNLLLIPTVFFVTIMNVTAQFYYKPMIIGNVTPNSCSNSVVLETFNEPTSGWMELLIPSTGGYVGDIEAGDTVNNFCMQDFEVGNWTSVDYFSTNGYLIHAHQLSSSGVPAHLNYTVTDYVAPTSNQSADGTLTIVFDSTNILSNYNIAFSQQNSTPDTTTINPTNLQFNSLEEGYLQLLVMNQLDSSDYVYFRIYLGDIETIYVNTGLNVGISYQHADNNCEGWINISASNVTGTLMNHWSDGPYNELFRVGLCPGLYSSYTYDFLGGEYVTASIDTVIITDDNTAYIDSSIYTTPSQDTSYYNFQNCQFDYNAPIDSMSYYEDTLHNSGGLVIVTYVMTMYQDSSSVTVTDSLVMVNDSLIVLDVIIYCDFFKNAFDGRRIVYMRGADEHNFYQNGWLGIKDEKIPEFIIYPNPAQDVLKIDFEAETPAHIQIYNLQGVKIDAQNTSSGNTYEYDVSLLPNGMYLVEVTTSHDRQSRLFIKE